MPAFQATCRAHLQQAIPADDLRPIWVFSQDEGHFGVLTVRRRRLTAQRLTLPENVCPVFLPPYGPELNPIERVWCDLKDALAWLQFPALEVQQEYLATLIQGV